MQNYDGKKISDLSKVTPLDSGYGTAFSMAAAEQVDIIVCYADGRNDYEASWNLLTTSGHFNGIAGIVIAVLLLAGSLVRIGMRSASDDSGSIISLVLFAIGASIAFAVTPIYRYMQKWAVICLIMGILSVLMIMWKNSRQEG